MRSLLRNQQPVFFRLYEGEEEIVDQYGNATGTRVPVYGDLMSAMLCVSPNKGKAESEQFGTLLSYDRTMTTADTRVKIDENAVLWVDNADTSGPWNYVVTKRAPWKNSIQFAISKVAVSAYNEYQAALRSLMESRTANGNEEDQTEP